MMMSDKRVGFASSDDTMKYIHACHCFSVRCAPVTVYTAGIGARVCVLLFCGVLYASNTGEAHRLEKHVVWSLNRLILYVVSLQTDEICSTLYNHAFIALRWKMTPLTCRFLLLQYNCPYLQLWLQRNNWVHIPTHKHTQWYLFRKMKI